jgi:hypothetical protein
MKRMVRMPAARVEPINASFNRVIKSLKGLCAGTAAILDGPAQTRSN